VARDKTNPNKALTVSWWMSRRVQKYLDGQLSDPINAGAYGKIAKIRKEQP
jgi:hypothetical protein